MSTTFNVRDFRAALNNGGIRPNQFLVQLTYPTYVTNTIAIRKSPFLVSIAELPGSIVNPAIVFYRGREVNFAGDRVFAPWTITVLNDGDMSVRRAIEQWMNGMDDVIAKIGRLTPSDYQTDLEINQLDRNGTVLKRYKLRDAFPIDASPIGLDFGANDVISTFTVTWRYQDYLTDF